MHVRLLIHRKLKRLRLTVYGHRNLAVMGIFVLNHERNRKRISMPAGFKQPELHVIYFARFKYFFILIEKSVILLPIFRGAGHDGRDADAFTRLSPGVPDLPVIPGPSDIQVPAFKP